MLKEYFDVLTWQDVFLAACLAFVITYAIRSVWRRKERKKENNAFTQSMKMGDVFEKCRELFPIPELNFDGKKYKRGMRLRLKTVRGQCMEGEFIGMNRVDLICLRSHNQIIAYQLEKIEEIEDITEPKQEVLG